MSIITISTPFNIDLEFRIAPFYKRLVAWLIDIAIIYAFIYIMFKAIQPFNVYEYVSVPVVYLFIMLPAYSYHLLMEIFLNGQSVGKKAMGIRVVDISGNSASLSQYLLRWVLRIIDMGISLGLAGIISAAVSKNTQRLGDLAAGTVVIDQHYGTGINETIYLEVNDKDYQPRFPQVIRLSDRDINGIHNLLNLKNNSKDALVYMDQVVVKIKELLQIDTEMQGREFLEQLLWDYNFLTRQ